jgi:hypothetical protein
MNEETNSQISVKHNLCILFRHMATCLGLGNFHEAIVKKFQKLGALFCGITYQELNFYSIAPYF